MSSLTKENVEQIIRSWKINELPAAPFEFVISSNITEIDKDAFLPMGYVRTVILKSESSAFIVENNCLYSAVTGKLYFACAQQDGQDSIVLPGSIKEINLYAFPDGIHQVEVPNAVQEIPIKAGKSAELKSFIEQRNQKVRAKREKIQMLLKLKVGDK